MSFKAYIGNPIKDPLGNPTEFRIFPSGSIYDFAGKQIIAVGKMDRKGNVHVKNKFINKYPKRAQILRELLEEKKEEK